MRVVRYTESKASEWNQFINAAKNGLFLFRRSYMDYHKDRYADHSLMIYKKEKLVSVFPANENSDIIWSHSGLTFGGLIMSFGLKTEECITIFEQIILYYKSLGIVEINYKAISHIFPKYPAHEDLYALFRHNAILYRRDVSSAVDISQKIKFSETKRQAIKKCVKEKVELLENDNFTDYWILLSQLLTKFNATPVHTLEEIHFLKMNFPRQIRLFEARRKGELLAGVVIYDYGNVAHTQYMANSANGRKSGALDFINFQLINHYFKDHKYYSFGISTENEGKFLNEGLIQQKEMMGGRAVTNDFYKIKII